MNQRPLPIPSWAPAAAMAGLVVWAVSIWWMVATLPTGGDTGTVEQGLSIIASEVERANATIATLSGEVAALQEERHELLARVADLEARRPLSGAFEMSVDDEAEGAATAEDDGDIAVEDHPLFTNGEDRYNCRDFASFEEAQEALRVNGPDDPNRIDMNRNGIACEDFRYPTPAAPAP
jgi:hypothetical protein